MNRIATICIAAALLWTEAALGQSAASAGRADGDRFQFPSMVAEPPTVFLAHAALNQEPDDKDPADGASAEKESTDKEPAEDESAEDEEDDESQSKLTGNWHGRRDELAESGLTIDFDGTYVLQGVVAGGLEGPLFDLFSDEGDVGNTLLGDLQMGLDTCKAGLWKDGQIDFQLQGRTGLSVVQRAGSVSVVNNSAIIPNVEDEFDGDAVAVAKLTYQHSLSESLAIFAGLMNTAEGDENAIGGSALSQSHFLNTAMLYSLVEDATVPNTSLGGGISYEPNDQFWISISVFGSNETAGHNPFDDWNGTTFSAEWMVAHDIAERGGAQTFGALYGIDASRLDIAASPRIVIGSVLLGLPVPSTEANTWSLYYNAHQYIVGDAEEGWGMFTRLGVSDGNPNLVKWNAALGVGGTGFLCCRKQDQWGLGSFYFDMSDEDLLQGLGVSDEVGGELYYNVAVSPWFHVTLDAQVINSALPNVDTSWIFGVRTHINF